uniref:Receptor expression-enhancing protein n=1 Tax=Chromera velia CCMP2878 TaxID=1169474 RepID=A0A0G4IFN2_9ALVE|mmetsp:Transcript_17609/g.35732  ORF Transcript_17609/g.35732 Transcript_17609/m.35732 type:complete len:122 (+) Transcript_17609:231-596(+)|eukprot:Cvel_13973.t1-p1 / transcript=Cvel_13973.t1 / gene=Cvel_13973 / organism=Chromera_velia_CCMP2878 / gene_product=hypothetical protein / transcript_product=hypothetical protein / location=Cvel_scaffold976:39838-41681(-) / protein_length=121 / sequence_SO=supercontig / SO=protein_coding / is_pseudo=false
MYTILPTWLTAILTFLCEGWAIYMTLKATCSKHQDPKEWLGFWILLYGLVLLEVATPWCLMVDYFPFYPEIRFAAIFYLAALKGAAKHWPQITDSVEKGLEHPKIKEAVSKAKELIAAHTK